MSEQRYVPSSTPWVRNQVEEIDKTGDTRSVQVLDRPVVLLTIVGAKSGLPRKVPLMRVEEGGRYAAVASKGGDPKHPAWYVSLKKNPDITLQDGTRTGEFTARELSGEERRTWWERSVAAFPQYAEYQLKTDRLIPVFVLEPR